jgi:DNA polymerase III subunit delta'
MTFRDIAGHRRLKRLLMRALQAGSLPPSLVFAGPDGVGKRQVALALAQALNCLQPRADAASGERDACGICPSCHKIARGLHPDVTLVEPEDGGPIKIDQVRDAVAHTAFRPFEGRTRVVIVDQADLLNEAAQNALLKPLEEPPARNVFVLVASRPHLLLTTVRSRCCILRFGPISAGDIAAALVSRHGCAEDAARKAAALAGGSLARARELSGGGFDDARAEVAAVLGEAARSTGTRERVAVGAALLRLAAKKGKRQDKGGKESGADRASLAARLRAMGSLLRDLAVLTTRAPEASLVNLDLRAELEPLARMYGRDRIGRAFSAVGRSLVALERHNASPKIVADWLALQL